MRLNEKGGKQHIVPRNHHLQQYLAAHIQWAGIENGRKVPLFRTIRRGSRRAGAAPLTQSNVDELITRKPKAAGIASKIGCHSMRGTAIANLLENGAIWWRGFGSEKF